MLKRNLIIIPARKGSKRIKNKNLIKILNKPLITWTINYAKKIAEELKLKGFIDRRFSFGINATTYRYGDNGEIGLYINSVDYDNSADNKALYKGDIIIGIEGYQIQSYDQLKLVLANNDARPGDMIKLRIQRENEIKVVNLVLGKS